MAYEAAKPSSTYSEVKRTINQRYGQLKNDRSLFVSHWREIQQNILPEHGRGLSGETSETEDKDGTKKMGAIYDGTATRSCDVAAAGMQAGMMSPSRPWFRAGSGDPTLDDTPEIKEWLFEVNERMLDILAKSNCYNVTHHMFLELLGFGTAACAQLESFNRVVNFRAFTIGEYLLATDEEGRVNTCYRDIWMTSTQMIDEFGEENVSESVKNAFHNGGTETRFKVLHAVEPHDDRIRLPEIGGKRWRSIYCEEKGNSNKILRARGFNSFPVLAPRWFVAGNKVYGVGLGARVLPDVKQLQKETEQKLVALDKMIDPPVVSPGTPTELQVNSFPGGVTYDTSVGAGSIGQGLRPLYAVNPPLQYLMQDLNDLRLQIQKGLFNDLFLMLSQMPSNSKMTAREVAERHEEKLLMLGPAIERLHSEMLTPLIDRLFDIMLEVGLIPPPPPELEGRELKIEYISILAQAQKMAGIGAIEQTLAFVGSIAGLKPEALDKIDFDEAIDIYADRTGVPPTMIADKDQVDAVRAQRAQQQQMAASIANGQGAAEAAKTLSEADTGGNTALSTLLGALPGGAGGGVRV